MLLNNNNSEKRIITIDKLKNLNELIKQLKLSLNCQKQFLMELNNILSSFFKNKDNNEEASLIDELITLLPEIISQLGIPFVYNFLNQDNVLIKFLNLYYQEYEEKVSKIFKICLAVFGFSLYYDYINSLKHELIEIGIIQNIDEYSNKNSVMNPEQIIFENIYSMLNKLAQLKDIGMDINNISKFESDYKDILKEIDNLHNKMKISVAQIEFYQELINPLDNYLKSKNKKKYNIKEEEKNIEFKRDNNEKNNNIIEKIEPIIEAPLEKRTFFYKDEIINEKRNQVIEFKKYSFPLNQDNRNEIKRHLCGFLNAKGGRLYIGINENNIVEGIELEYKKRDIIRNDLINITFDFYPKCRVDKIFVYFIPIKEYKTNIFLAKKYIIKIRIYPGAPDVLYSMTNKGGYHSTIRRNGQCIDLDSIEIYNEIIIRDEYRNIANNNNSNILKENEIKDPEPEINLGDLENNADNESSKIISTSTVIKNNSINNIKKVVLEKGKYSEKNTKDKAKKQIYAKEGTITLKVTNIDEDLTLKEVNKFFNGCKCSSQRFFNTGYGYVNFTNLTDANNCLANYEGKKLGNKKIKIIIGTMEKNNKFIPIKI